MVDDNEKSLAGGRHSFVVRSKAQTLLQELKVILILSNSLSEQANKELLKTELALAMHSRQHLRRIIVRLEREISSSRKRLGIQVDTRELVEYLTQALQQRPDPNLLPMISRSILRYFMPNLERIQPEFARWYDHTYIELDLTGESFGKPGWGDVYILEAALFEQACAQFNLAREHNSRLASNKKSKPLLKTTRALTAATIAAGFSFLEACLNGIATDHLTARVRDP